MLSPDKLSWLELSLIPRIGAVTFKGLLDRFSHPENVFKAKSNQLITVEGISRNLAEDIAKRKSRILLDKQLKLIERYKVDILTFQDQRYPENLKSVYGAPVLLFIKGNILPDDYFSIAIVGTRKCSSYGKEMSERISTQLVKKGMSIVSGGARGIDTYAHQAALKSSGRTIAVLGCGLDIAYPLENKELFDKISRNGAVISEFPLGTKPEKQNFPMSNRVVSGMSLGVLVVEAPQRSGALITARCALEEGKEVFSIPGKAGGFTSAGSNQLLREGAKLVETADDILEELESVIRHKIREVK